MTGYKRDPEYYKANVCGADIMSADVTDALDMSHHRAAAFEYIWRAGRKSADTYVADLHKAIWHLQREADNADELSFALSSVRAPVAPKTVFATVDCPRCGNRGRSTGVRETRCGDCGISWEPGTKVAVD